MVALTFYGAVGEIGGNKILLEDGDTRVLFDFGMSFGGRDDFFSQFLQPRKLNGLGDLLELGLVPRIERLYRKDLIESTDLKEKQFDEPVVDALFLTHPHADHASYITFLDERVPIYCGEVAKLILESMEKTGRGGLENEVIAYRPLGKKDWVTRKLETFHTGVAPISVDGIEITPVHVDHSVPGSYGFVIETSEGTIVHTGDLRHHGIVKEHTDDFIKEAKKVDPIALIIEGTNIGEKEATSEAKVREDSDNVVENTEKLVIFSCSGRDIDRLRTFFQIAKDNNRLLAIAPSTAYMLERVAESTQIEVPDTKDPNIAIYMRRKDSGTYAPTDYGTWKRPYVEDGGKSERDYLEYDNMWKAEDVHDNQSEVLIQLDDFKLAELVDIDPEQGGHMIHSSSMPFNEEMEIAQNKRLNWLDHFGIQDHQIHASGHAPRSDLIYILDEIDPKVVFPIHTEHPLTFSRLDAKAQYLTKSIRKGVRYLYQGGTKWVPDPNTSVENPYQP